MGIAQLCTNGVLPKLSTLIDGFSSINHIISEVFAVHFFLLSLFHSYMAGLIDYVK